MKILLISIIAVIMILASVQNSLAGEDSISFGAFEVKKGMEKSYIISNLEKYFDLLPDESKSNYSIVEKNAKPPYEFVGHISFIEDKVTLCSRDWGSFNDLGAERFFKTLFDLLVHLGVQEKGGAFLNVWSTTTPKFNSYSIYILLDKKKVSINWGKMRKKEEGRFSLSIQEHLR